MTPHIIYRFSAHIEPDKGFFKADLFALTPEDRAACFLA
jgi:hypothetical protein